MANKKINELDSRASLSLSDLLAVGDPTTGYLYKITITDLKSLTGAGVISFNGRVGSVVPAEGDYSLNQLSDVIITTAANGNIVKYNGSNWVNVPMYTGTIAQYVDGTGAYQTFPTLLSSDRLLTEVRNTTGATVTKGTVIYLNGSSGTLPTIAKAQANSEATSSTTYGVVQNDIANNANGYVVVIGNLTGIDTSAYNAGDILWLSPTVAGGYTTTKPSAPNNSVYIGIVTRSNNTAGTIEVKIQNGYELDELHNVAISSVANNQVLVYESSSTLWKNKSIATILGFTPISLSSLSASAPLSYNSGTGAFSISLANTSTDGYLSSTDWNTFNGKQNALTNPVTGTGVSGRVAYFNGTTSQTSSANLTWDNTNSRLGIGLTNPQRSLEIYNATADSHLRLSGAAPSVSMGEAVTGAVYQAKFGLVTINAQFITGSLAGDFVIISQTGATIWATSGGEKMRLTSGGNLGIGTTAPGAALDVLSIIRATNNATTGLNTSNIQLAAHNGTSVVVSGSMFQTNSTFSYQQISPNQTNIYGTAANGMRIATANAPIIFATGNSDADFSTARLTITSAGYVGIGTSSPGASLHVANSNGQQVFRVESSAADAQIRIYNTGSGGLTYSLTSSTASSGAGQGFSIYDETNGANRFKITSGGNVGIGTSSPSYKLDVRGNGMFNGDLQIDLGELNTPKTLLFNGNSDTGGSFGNIKWKNVQWDGFTRAEIVVEADGALSNGRMVFKTGATGANAVERMRITSGGSLLVGTTANDFGSRQVNNSASSYTFHSVRTGTGSEGHLVFSNANGAVGSIFTNGSSTSYNTSSDYRLKQDLKQYNGLSLINLIKTYDYEWKADNTRSYGVLAHELANVLPYAVSGEKDGEMMQGVDYSKIVPVLVKAMQEQQAQIEQLKTQIK